VTRYDFSNGSASVINGRGVLHCHPDRRLDLAAAAVMGQLPFRPSITQAVPAFQVSRADLKERIRLYRALETNGNGSQAAASASVWGHCCICGKELTDPISLERGIGPECIKGKIEFIKILAQDGRSLEHITMLTGMPVGFVTEILNEARHV
jgi:hypothetical protein